MTAGPVDSQDLIDEFVGGAHGGPARVQTLLAAPLPWSTPARVGMKLLCAPPHRPAGRRLPDHAPLLTEFGAVINAGAVLMTALHGAVRFDQHEIVRWLVAHGANPCSLDSNGKTPFDLAVEHNRTDILKTLRKNIREQVSHGTRILFSP